MDSNWNDNQPIYRQLRDKVVAMILEGTLGEGEALPSVRSVAAEHTLNPLTVLKGYQQLVDEGLVEQDPSEEVGAPRVPQGLPKALTEAEVDEAFGRCRASGAVIQSPPEPHYVEDEDYYAFFVFDPDGIRVEVCHWSDAVRSQWDEGLHLEVEP